MSPSTQTVRYCDRKDRTSPRAGRFALGRWKALGGLQFFFGFKVDRILGKNGQCLVGHLFFFECFLQKPRGIAQAQFFRPSRSLYGFLRLGALTWLIVLAVAITVAMR